MCYSTTLFIVLIWCGHVVACLCYRCRDATKIDKTRLPTLTKLRRVTEACQSSLHNARSGANA
jgi:hypothetical protein